MTYDTNGFMKTRTVFPSLAAAGLTTTYIRNQKGWVTKFINPDGKEVTFSYDPSGNVIEKVENIAASSTATTKFEYDIFNRLTQVTSPKNEVTKYSYDELGNLLSVVDPKNRMTSFEYNSRNQLIKKTDAFGAVIEMNYDGNGNMTYMKDPNGKVRSMQYNLVNDLTQVTLPDDVITYIYDVPGEKAISASNKNSTISYFRNLKGQNLNESISGAGDLSSYPDFYISSEYNRRDLLSEQQTPVGNISYGYDELNRLTSMNAFLKNYSFNYDGASRLSEVARGNIRTSYVYQDQQLRKITHANSSVSLAEYEYSYDLRNYPTQKRSLASVVDYGYDQNGQLIQANGGGAVSESYSYDNIGNRLSDQSRTYEYDITGQRLNQDSLYTYQYDNNGNLINKISRDGLKESHHYEYSSLNQLIKVQVMSGSIGSLATIREISYAYDVLGRRMQKNVKDYVNSKAYARKYAYNGSNIIAEYDGNNALLAKYTHSPLSADDLLAADISSQGVVAGISNQSGVLYYLKDHQNTVTEIANEAGNVVQKFEYSSFGEIQKIKDGSDNVVSFSQAPVKTSFTYTAREFEPETGLYYYRARYYDSSNGRFLQQDPDPGVLRLPETINNRYSYTANSPSFKSDPSGKVWWVVVVAIVSFATTAFENNRNGGNFLQQYVKNFAISALLYGIGYGIGELFGFPTAYQGASASQVAIDSARSIGINAGIEIGAANGYWSRDTATLTLLSAGYVRAFNGEELTSGTDAALILGNILTGNGPTRYPIGPAIGGFIAVDAHIPKF